MKNLLLIMLGILMLTACGGSNKPKVVADESSAVISEVETAPGNPIVYVYYFHGKQRCTTCNTVEKVAREIINEIYADNSDVRFQSLSTADKANEQLVEKYNITWNGLIIAKGDSSVNITRQAFASAVNNPQTLKEMIKAEVDKRLAE